MSGPPHPEYLNQKGFSDFAERAGEGKPVVMLNLLRFLPEGGWERYAEYGVAVTPLLEKAGARIVFVGEPAPPLLGEEGWDLVVLAEFPTRQAFLELVGSKEYLAIAHLRTEALTLGELHPMDPGDPSLADLMPGVGGAMPRSSR
jgi:uncharacterized protein (DUF1330 family)